MKKSFRSISIVTVLIAVLSVLFAVPAAAQDADAIDEGGASPRELIARAERAIEAAEDASDDAARDALYDEAIASYRAVLDAGIANAAIHRNIGTAQLLKGDVGRAIASFRRAERLDPRDARVADSLEAARGMVRTEVTAGTGARARDAVFFWRGFVPRSALAWAGVAGWAVLWIGVAWRLLSAKRGRGVGVALVGAAVFVVAFGSLAGERFARAASPGAVIVQDGVTGYRGPSEGVYEPSFEEPIRAGVEGSVLERRENWVRLRLRSGTETWVRVGAIERI